MRKTFKNILSVGMSLIMAISTMAITTLADEEVLYGLSTSPPVYNYGEISTYDNNYPTATWNLSTNGSYYVEGSAKGSAYIYTKYNFTGVDSIAISLTNNSSSNLTVILYKNGILDTQKGSFTVSANSNGGQLFTGLDENSKYYFAFSAPCDFWGYIA